MSSDTRGADDCKPVYVPDRHVAQEMCHMSIHKASTNKIIIKIRRDVIENISKFYY